MHIETVLTQLRSLQLSTMAASLERRLAKNEQQGLDPEEFVALLVSDEYETRQERKLNRMIARANFKPEQACIENIDYSSVRGLQKKEILQFTTASWITQAANIALIGPTGAGKTYIAEAIGLQACKMGFSAKKIRFKMLFEELNNARATGQLLKYLKSIQQARVLILDDFLMTKTNDEDAAYLLEMIEERSQIGPVILTTQYPIAKWHQLMPNPTTADAICDRLAHTAIVINIKGDSYRKNKIKPAKGG
jgi:DNA replication protein DnaC